ncbi:MAG: Uncharacterized protein AUK63_417 [bacterium P3]|nr:MAG: Uncharacterized protein AUK63_417 [bacterium P3]KWW42623.1 MAG: Uncharacterized protein F083_27 [bacterium F083]
MGHKCFISFKKEDISYKKEIQEWKENNKVDMIDKSLNTPINSDDEDYIMRKIREDYLSDSTVTIFLIGTRSSENLGWEEQKYIKRELQASLYNGEGNTRSGILGVVLPQMYDSIYKGSYDCSTCGNSHKWVAIGNDTVIKEFGRNYYLNSHGKCSFAEEDRYCVLVKWIDFSHNPNTYIDMAFNKRSQSIANDVVVRPK